MKKYYTQTQMKIQFLKTDLQTISEELALSELRMFDFRLKEQNKIAKLLKKRNKIEKQLEELKE